MQPSPISRCALAIGLAGLQAIGCGTDKKPEPLKLEQASPYERDVRDNKPEPIPSVPTGPDGAQVTAAEIEAALAEAAKYAAAGDLAQQRIALGKCANKT